jgi:phosphoglycolate phosphatase
MLTVGFDLDLTLLESRPGIRRSLDALSAETGVAVDPDVVIARLGAKLEDELSEWFPAKDVPHACERYRAHYWEFCVDGGTLLMPGARSSVDAVHALGGRAFAITAKAEAHSHRCLDTVGLALDGVIGHVHGDEKATALRAIGAQIYIGDTISDVRAGVAANAIAIGVATGMHNAEELGAAGANPVFASLDEFPAWLAAQ